MLNIFDIMNDNDVDGYLVSDEANMRYLLGFTGEGYVLMSNKGNIVFTDSRYTIAAKNEVNNAEVITIDTSKDTYYSLISRWAKKFELKKIGFEGSYLCFNEYESFSKAFDFAKLLNLSNKLDSVRIIKNEKELEKLRIAESIGDKAFTHVLNHIKEGITEKEVANMIEWALKDNGGEKTSFDTIVASGLNGALPHAVPTDKKIKNGELVTMDFGCKYEGYCSDMTRTICIGKASEEQRKVYNIVLEAQLTGLKAIKPNIKCSDVDKAARDVIAKNGYGEYFGHGLGHSVGLKIHEDPRFSPKCDTITKPNMIMTVEPGIYIEGFGGIRIEDMVVITENGHENFASSKKELIEII